MRMLCLATYVLLLAEFGLGPITADAAAPSAAGLWQKADAAGNPEAWFRIMDCNGVFEGRIARVFAKSGEDPQQWKCTECEGDQKDAPVVGIRFIKGMRRNGSSYEGGTILDPRDGSVYDASMRLSADGNRLTVRGFLGIPLLGESQVWQRISDQKLPAAPDQSCGNKHAIRVD